MFPVEGLTILGISRNDAASIRRLHTGVGALQKPKIPSENGETQVVIAETQETSVEEEKVAAGMAALSAFISQSG